ncbi:hypothetical protein [Enterococcus gallinarum]|uniref:hypothetical protein n=1 Tax=Enterococcus gallinarum TaxID=1353 RepID=UPI0010749665|nr:hypothetical protein [Enterococcus gallinarum]MBF0825555.1 hypothetical protein [Enterococcus faecalis]MBX8989961.1 hypothetical protein [Escherichia coli]MBF0726215.1 hypothetical protein [Enterococcus gallinarum]MBF0799142.1 hypothetical protein [Enterococcus gallinarum]NYS82316.1 hypothetical protein [Enterococcus gallinarum]
MTKYKIIVIVVGVCLLILGGCYFYNKVINDAVSVTDVSKEDAKDQRIAELEAQITKLEELYSSEDKDFAKKAELENSILALQDQLVNVMYDYDDVYQRNPSIIPFIFSEERVKDLHLTDEPKGYPDMTCNLLDHRNYIRQMNETNYEVLTTALVEYNSDEDTDTELFLWIQYRKTEDGQWKVYYMRVFDNPIEGLYDYEFGD